MSDEFEECEAPFLEMGADFAYSVFEQEWGHPARWPSPSERPPSFFSFRAKKREREMISTITKATGFTKITDEMRRLYWRELRKGQDVYEDAGGYFERAYMVMLGYRQPDNVRTHESAAADLIAEAQS